MKHLASMLALLQVAGIVLAQEEEIAPDIAATNSVNDVAVTNMTEVLEATNRIEEADSELLGLRDPFWPVGYEPAPPEVELTEEEVEQVKIEEEIEKKIHWPALHLKGITSAGKGRYMAIIAGIGLVESDQTVRLRRGDMLYSWLIEKVTTKGVMITRLEARPYQLPTIGVRTQ
ncbi:MAG: hypothetical protein ISS31_04305 [Kiritimatiellae bacterium]|nr:hypothetical protein [Kiritimatiellia bacterium]